MKKVAVFVEGQSELIFVRNLLFYLLSPQKFSFECFKLHAETSHTVPYEYPNPAAEIYFQIMNVEGDEKVLQTIERQQYLLKDFDKIIGLRDMYSKQYRKISPQKIDMEVIKRFIDETSEAIQDMPHASKIDFHFAIMEIEAWWLGMYNVFAKIDSRLTPEFIKAELKYDLTKIDPQTEFFHPADIIEQIYYLIGKIYTKRKGQAEDITQKINEIDILDLIESGHCASFKQFYESLTTL